jgi:chorismate dehydratase
VRVFSRVPPADVRRLFVDGDSHTSVALARVLWREMYGVELAIQPMTDRREPADAEAVLLIGDKVVNHQLVGFEIETDLGSMWKSLTGLPFVFAVWTAPGLLDTELLSRKLEAARDAGVQSAAMIAADFGPGMGWPVELARRYLVNRLKFTIGERERLAMTRFFALAGLHELVPNEHQPAFA